MAYIGNDVDAVFIPESVNTSTSLTITGGALTQTGGDVNFDSGTLFIDESENRVGIGITQPLSKLHLNDSSLNQVGVRLQNSNTGGRTWLLQSSGGEANNGQGAFSIYDVGAEAYRLTIDSSGRLLVGTSTAVSNVQWFGTTYLAPIKQTAAVGHFGEGLFSYTNSGSAPAFYFNKSRGTTVGSNVVVQNNDLFGEVVFAGNDGTNFIRGAVITGLCDGTPDANDMPGRLVFSTTADGSASPTERMRIDSSGRLGLGTSSPSTLLHVATSGTAEARISKTGSPGTAALSLQSSGSGGRLYTIISADSTYTSGAGLHIQQTDGLNVTFKNTGQVGIGTTAPTTGYLLDVNGGIRTNAPSGIGLRLAASSAIRDDAAVQSTMYFDVSFGGGSHGNFVWRSSSNAVERARIDSSGRLGLGTSSPQANFDLAAGGDGNANGPTFALWRNSASPAAADRIGTIHFDGEDSAGARVTYKSVYGQIGSPTSGSTTGDLVIGADDTGAGAQVVISSSGNVGIGKTNPSSKLSVVGNLAISDSPSSERTVLSTSGGGFVINHNDNSPIYFQTQSSTKLTIRDSGNVGIGKTDPNVILETNVASGNNEFRQSVGGVTYAQFISSSVDQYIVNLGTGGQTFWNGGSERARIDGSGRLLVGTPTTYSTNLLASPDFQLNRQNADTTAAITCWKADNIAFNPGLQFQRSYANTNGTHTALPNGAFLGTIRFAGSDGTKFLHGAEIRADADGSTWTTNDAPTRLVFSTTADNSSSPTERMRIASNGNIGIGITNPSNKLDVSGVARITNYGAPSYLEIGLGQNSNQYAYIDLIGDTTYTDYGLRLIRYSSGANTDSELAHRGTGILRISTEDAGPIVFKTSNTERARITSDGYFKASNNGNYDGISNNYHEFRQNALAHTVYTTSLNASLDKSIYLALASRSANSAYQLLIGYSGGGADVEFNLRGDGNGYCDGSWTGGGADYAEMFEWEDGNPDNEDRRGYSVSLVGNKIQIAQEGDEIIGVISGNPSVIGDTAWNKWGEKYLRDDFGSYITETHNVVEWTDEDGKEHSYEDWNLPEGIVVPDDATIKTHDDKGNPFTHRKLNPEYNPDLEYVSREDRPEWDAVGMMGKLRLRKGQPVRNTWIKMRDINENVEEWLVR